MITLISLGGVALGVASMIIVSSVMGGFEKEIQKRILKTDLHLLVEPTPQTPHFHQGSLSLQEAEAFWTTFPAEEKSPILFLWPVLSTEVILKFYQKVKGLHLKGVTPSRLERLEFSLSEKIALDPRLPPLFVGKELALEMGIRPGSKVTLLSPTQVEGPLGNLPRVLEFQVADLYESGWVEQELSTVYTSLESAHLFLKKPSPVLSHWEILLTAFSEATAFKHRLKKHLPAHLRIRDWGELNAPLFTSLKWERIAMFIGMSFVVLVASFNILTTLQLMVLKKQKEISILKAMGATHAQVGAIFLSEGLWIGLIGIFLGLILGLGVCLILASGNWLTLPDIFYDRSLPVHFSLLSDLTIIGCSFLMIVIACLAPSQKAARLSPIQGIRH